MSFWVGGDTFVVQDQIQAFNKNPEARTKQPSEAQIREMYVSIEAALKDSWNNGLHGTFREWVLWLQSYNPTLAKSLLKAEVLQTLKLQVTEQASTDVSALHSDIVTEKKIKEILSDLSPDKIDASLKTVESLIDFIIDPKYKMILRSFAGSLMLEKFEANNQRVIVREDKTIEIAYIDSSKQSTLLDQNNTILQTKINARIKENSWVIDTIRSGMLFRAQSVGITQENAWKTAVVVKMESSSQKDLQAYLKTLSGRQNLTIPEQTLLLSQKGFQDFENPPELRDVTKLQEMAQKVLAQPQNTTPISSGPQSGSQIPSVVGEGIGMVWWVVGKIAGAWAGGGLKVLSDIFSSATKEGGPWGGLAVLGGIIAAFWKFGFWKTIGTIFGIGVLSEATAGRLDLGKEMDKVKNVAWKTSATLGGLSGGSSLVPSAPSAWSKPVSSSQPTEVLNISPSQEKANNKVMSDPDFVQAINEQAIINAQSNNGETKKKTGKVENYLNFINSPAFQSQKLENLLYVDNMDASIFSNNTLFGLKGIDVPENLDRQYLKRIVRMYIIGKYKISTPVTWVQPGQKEKEDFLKDKKKEDYKDKTLADLIKELGN